MNLSLGVAADVRRHVFFLKITSIAAKGKLQDNERDYNNSISSQKLDHGKELYFCELIRCSGDHIFFF